jgi:hypothetical protein
MIGWLENLGLMAGVSRSPIAYAVVSAGHVLGIALLIGPILIADLRLMGGFSTLDLRAVTVLRRVARLGLALTLATGMLLLSARPAEYLANPVVQAKLLVVMLAILNALAFEMRARRLGLDVAMATGRLAAIVSMLGWLGALSLGRWIAFSQ